MTLDEVKDRWPDVSVELHGVDLSVYLLFTVTDDALEPITDRRGNSLQFTSDYAARTALRDAGVTQFDFVHSSPYGEMVGMEGSAADTEMRITINLKLDQ